MTADRDQHGLTAADIVIALGQSDADETQEQVDDPEPSVETSNTHPA